MDVSMDVFIHSLKREDIKDKEILTHLCIWLWEDIAARGYESKTESEVLQIIKHQFEDKLNTSFLGYCPMCMAYDTECGHCPLNVFSNCHDFRLWEAAKDSNVRYFHACEIVRRSEESLYFVWEQARSYANLPSEGDIVEIRGSDWQYVNGICEVRGGREGDVQVKRFGHGSWYYFPAQSTGNPEFRIIKKRVKRR